ncbi:MAG: molybdenum cofactor guanylyltransferase [Elusimicrobia bacterium]|nr:molybdenum cofactor guanylyltransferase [Elusimicrobiota bacterium]
MNASEFAFRRPFLRSLSAIVLAGGASVRYGSDKTRSRWGGRSLVAHVALGLRELVDDVVVVTRRPEALKGLSRRGLRLVKDRFTDHHPMGGVATGLSTTRHRAAFVCAADMPLIEPGLIGLLGEAASGYDAAVPVWRGRLEPLCAVYSKRSLGVLEKMVSEGRLALVDLFDIMPTRFVQEDEVRAVDPAGRSFCDIDTKADRAKVEKLGRGRRHAR